MSRKVSQRPLYNIMDGVVYPAKCSPKYFREALNYNPQSDDVFVVTYPKSGTTWMLSVALHIFRKGKELEDPSEFLMHCPYIELLGKEGIEKMPRPGAFKTHIPYTHLPYSPEAKYVFVARNPKDCVVSFYHLFRSVPDSGYWKGSFDDFFEHFMNGELNYNDYFDHILSWYPHRNDNNVFYTTYEEMSKDINNVILNLAKFLGKEFIDAIERDNSVLNNIILYTSFDYMKRHLSEEFYSEHRKGKMLNNRIVYQGLTHCKNFIEILEISDNVLELDFFRKGIVGDWKNVLTEEQNQRLDEKLLQKTKGTEIPNWF